MMMIFDSTVAAETFIKVLEEKNVAKAIRKGRGKWKVDYTDRAYASDYVRVKYV